MIVSHWSSLLRSCLISIYGGVQNSAGYKATSSGFGSNLEVGLDQVISRDPSNLNQSDSSVLLAWPCRACGYLDPCCTT